MKILITGGTTFVSKYAAEYFVSKDNDVTVINRGSRPQVNGVAHISCDRTALGDRLNGKHFDLLKFIFPPPVGSILLSGNGFYLIFFVHFE